MQMAERDLRQAGVIGDIVSFR